MIINIMDFVHYLQLCKY